MSLLPKSFHDTKDGRLFPTELLYCEGLHKPLCRGLLHLACTLLLPFGLLLLYLETNGDRTGILCATFYVISNIICYGTSSLYHVGKWSVQTEILLQKIDHCGIAILSTGTMVPLTLLLLPPPCGYIFLAISIISCIWCCIQIIRLKPSVFWQVIVAASIVPFMPICYKYMNSLEWHLTLACICFQSLGVCVFVNEKPCPNPAIFGHHEVFHLLVVMAGFCVFVVNWSIVRRTCNPYTPHMEVLDDILHLVAFIFSKSL